MLLKKSKAFSFKLPFTFCGVIILSVLMSSCGKPKSIQYFGDVFGTTYSVQYYSEEKIDFQDQFDSLFYQINKSMSTYQGNSKLSHLNNNVSNTIDDHFIKVFDTSKEIYKETEGYFDPTIGILVNAWDFGPSGMVMNLDSLKVDSMMTYVGMDKIKRVGHKIIKEDPHIYIDFNAIAKGYGVDVIADFLEAHQIENYIVEIGGEIRVKGSNIEKEQPWRIGVEMPHFDGTQSVMIAIELQDEAMATSGSYRKFKTDELGNRYSHIIDTKTGYPSRSNLLSISVIAKNCMTADAYATAIKAMGMEKALAFLKSHPELKVFLIFENDQKELETKSINGFPENLKEKK